VIRETSGAKAAENHLREARADGPCIAWVDGYHVVTVYVINDDKGVALIGDLADEPEEMALPRLAETRGRIKQYKNRLLSLPAGNGKQDLLAVVRSGLQACQTGLKKGKRGPEAMSGLERLAALRDQLAPSWCSLDRSCNGRPATAGPRFQRSPKPLHPPGGDEV